MALTFETFKSYIPAILSSMPQSWRGTTFKNHNLLGRAAFTDNLANLILAKNAAGVKTITTEELLEIGNAEDYLRVSSNISCTLEIALALKRQYKITQVITFSSVAMPIIAVLHYAEKPVQLYIGGEASPFTEDQIAALKIMGYDLSIIASGAQASSDAVVLALEAVAGEDAANIDGIIARYTLYIANPDAISEANMVIARKRMSIPITTPVAIYMLEQVAGVTSTEPQSPDDTSVAEFLSHLQTLAGTDVNPDVNPIVCTAGLPTICSLWMALITNGGADILMCSTAYGGSNQLTDILTSGKAASLLKKHVFHIQGQIPIDESITKELGVLASKKDTLMPTTLMFVEIPTNPDMKVPDLNKVAENLVKYKETSGKDVILLVDATFAPGSQVLKKMKEVAPDLTVVVFLSMSKSVSRGLTTAGSLTFNHTAAAKTLQKNVASMQSLLDSTAKPDQMGFLTGNHTGVEDRCATAYKVAVDVGAALQAAVEKHTEYEMPLAFVTPEQAASGFTTSTFSFNLPSPKGASAEVCAALAQKFVDIICKHKEFKPCVSFGQDNGLVYATVPATSTQGAIKEEHKAKQAVGGVQLVRLSFAPTSDVTAVSAIITDAIATLYSS